jgi:serine/threonine protein kinase
MPCPDENTLSGFVEGLLSEQERSDVERHVDECRACATVLVALGRAVAETVPYRTPDAALGPGGRVGRYEILSQIGRGGMGSVYAARDPMLDRVVALKVLHAEGASGSQERLLREARALARLPHPNVVAVYDVGEDDGRIFIAMELVQGTSLRLWLQEKPRAWDEVGRAFLQAADGLAAAHKNGILHRDFKPDNVLVGRDGRVRVMDFGLARSVEAERAPDSGGPVFGVPAAEIGITHAGTVLGTPAYMAPEQLRGYEVDARADQFAFCVALHEALYGVRPYTAPTLAELRQKYDRGEPLRVPAPGAVPTWIFPILARGLSLDRERRYKTMSDLSAELREGLLPQADIHVKINAFLQILMWPVHTGLTVFLVWGMLSDTSSSGGGGSHAGEALLADHSPTRIISLVIAVWLVLLFFVGWAPLGVIWTPINAYGLLRKRRWAYISTVVYAVFSLLTCVGTPFAAYALATLWSRARKKIAT